MSAATLRPKRVPTQQRTAGARVRAAARNRALARLAREYPERYRQLYDDERGERS
jgi:hypothetical protein